MFPFTSNFWSEHMEDFVNFHQSTAVARATFDQDQDLTSYNILPQSDESRCSPITELMKLRLSKNTIMPCYTDGGTLILKFKSNHNNEPLYLKSLQILS